MSMLLAAPPLLRHLPGAISRMPRELLAWLTASLLLCSLLTGCATLSGPRQVDLPLNRLQDGLARRFPVEQRIFEVIGLRLEHPILTPLPDSERLQVALTTVLDSPMMAQPWRGQLTFSGRLTLDPTHQTILLRDGRIEQFTTDGLEDPRRRLLTRIADFVAGHFLQDVVVHTFKPEELEVFGTRYTPVALRPTATGLRITLEPARPTP